MYRRRKITRANLATLVRSELDAERIRVAGDGPTFDKAMSLARFAYAQGVEPRTAARWAVVRITQHVALEERAKLV